jgi:hypothetical protein
MPVTLTGTRGLSLPKIKAVSAAALFAIVTFGYLYGPAAAPLLRTAAASECNRTVGGNYRAFELQWQSGVRPHWACWDLREPGDDPVSLGWWVAF